MVTNPENTLRQYELSNITMTCEPPLTYDDVFGEPETVPTLLDSDYGDSLRKLENPLAPEQEEAFLTITPELIAINAMIAELEKKKRCLVDSVCMSFKDLIDEAPF